MLEMFHLSTAKLVNDQELQNWGTVAMEELHSPSFLSCKIVLHPIFGILIAHSFEIGPNFMSSKIIGALW